MDPVHDTASKSKTQSISASLNEQPIQNKAPILEDNRPASILQKKANNTGLPDNLKSGIENLSGHSMDDVKVQYNSSKPAQFNAHAYAQGTQIHIASGQEKHLPHEAWHVVQQKQGRVKPTLQMKGKVSVNDDKGLENEADVMGRKALQLRSFDKNKPLLRTNSTGIETVQRIAWWAPYALLGVTGLIGLYAWWNSGKKQPPPNLTDVTFKGNDAKEDMKDAFGEVPENELKMLGITTNGLHVTSPHHPDLFPSIGVNLKTVLGIETSRKLMSDPGAKYDKGESERLVKSAQVKKGEEIHKDKKNSKVIGESHNSSKDKAALIKRFAETDKNGPRTLYIEIIKEIQPVIDHWQNELKKNSNAPMPKTLKTYLSKLDGMMDKYHVGSGEGKIEIESDPLTTYTNIVMAAAKVGIRIVGMDSLHAKNMKERGEDPDNYKRAAAMNQSAFEVIKEDQAKSPSEYLVYTGHAHVSKQEYKDHPPLMGLADRLGIPAEKEKTE